MAKQFKDHKDMTADRQVTGVDKSFLKDIVKVKYNNYSKTAHKKTQIYLHQTAGRPDGVGTYGGWATKPYVFGTCVTISRKGFDYYGKPTVDGQINQGFLSKYYGCHLGIVDSLFDKFGLPWIDIHGLSIGIEICNAGYLTETHKGWESWYGEIVPESEMCFLDEPHRGHKAWERFTEPQIESVYKLLRYWNLEEIHGIPIKFKGMEIFDIDKRALAGEPGVYTHNSVTYPSVRCDIHPQPEMIEMLKSL